MRDTTKRLSRFATFAIATALIPLGVAGAAVPAAATDPAVSYGQVVDAPDSIVKAPGVAPGDLPQRPGDGLTLTGRYTQPFPGALGGDALLMRRGEYATVTGGGYIRVRWEIAWFNRTSPTQLTAPRWTGLTGKIFHVASAGGHRLDDRKKGKTYSWMGPTSQLVTLPSGMQQMWQNEYYYVDGSVTLRNTESGADYNVSVTPLTWDQVNTEVHAVGDIRYGIVRDDGTDATPVPQYATREQLSTQTELLTVPQHSNL